ncbi:Transcriptional regulator, LysR family protein [Shigella dysenteriae 1617]|uniref:Transcriptional regulator, LysR family protein n=1 Tax=Shigella dysenteriae 1617 TaxID=754093 RepID=A0A0A6ZZ77_SHIDY|nr:Transcriptional regulator, LysR family protein [Shigella dysenteriae 1617]
MAVTAAKSVMAFRVLTMAVDLCRLTTRTMNVNAGHERTSKARIIHQIQLIRGITLQDNIDLDIRINDEIPDYYIAHLLTKNKRILCAAPEYLQKYPQPQSLQELSRHDCLVTKERDMTHGIWELGNGQEKKSVKVSGHLSSNSGEIVLQWALEGKGIMLRSEWDVLPFLESGKLVQVLPEYAQSANIWAVYREPLYRSMKLRVCVEFLAAWCQQRLGKPDEGYQVM